MSGLAQNLSQAAGDKPVLQVNVIEGENGKSFLQLLVAQGILQISVVFSAKEARMVAQGMITAAEKCESLIISPSGPLPPPPARA